MSPFVVKAVGSALCCVVLLLMPGSCTRLQLLEEHVIRFIKLLDRYSMVAVGGHLPLLLKGIQLQFLPGFGKIYTLGCDCSIFVIPVAHFILAFNQGIKLCFKSSMIKVDRYNNLETLSGRVLCHNENTLLIFAINQAEVLLGTHPHKFVRAALG